jgi:hypothetical protein
LQKCITMIDGKKSVPSYNATVIEMPEKPGGMP